MPELSDVKKGCTPQKNQQGVLAASPGYEANLGSHGIALTGPALNSWIPRRISGDRWQPAHHPWNTSILACNQTIARGMAWTTPVDRVFNQKVFFYAFVGIIVGTTAIALLSDSPIGKPTSLQKPKPRGNGPDSPTHPELII
jgi:hypothetical protein